MAGEVTRRRITSLSNDDVKAARALHLRKARDERGLFLAEGLKLVGEAIANGFSPSQLFVGPQERAPRFLAEAMAATERAGGEVLEVTPEILGKIARKDNPQAVVGVFRQPERRAERADPTGAPVWIALEQVRDPGNLGTIVRTADACGAGGVFLIGDCCDPYSVEAVRASMGSIFAAPVFRLDLEGFAQLRARWPGPVVGTLLTATADYRDAPYAPPTLVLMGNEQSGLTASLAGTCDVSVKIPMRGRADSLNLSVASGLMLYAAADAIERAGIDCAPNRV